MNRHKRVLAAGAVFAAGVIRVLNSARRLTAFALVASAMATSFIAAAESKKTFDIVGGDAFATLKQFSTQADARLLYSVDAVKGVKTNPVKGVFTSREALNLLVAETGLVVTQNGSDGSLAVSRGSTARPNDSRAAPAKPTDRPSENRKSSRFAEVATDEVVSLSPFEVVADNKGYYAPNTMSGTRLNTKLEDLGASIAVVTKEQITDFAMLDINDIFNYEASTEGTANYTNVTFNQNGVPNDGVSLTPQGSNRIRGLGPASNTFGNFETSGRVPIDPLNLDAVEINRGPNSSVFGIGGTTGSVNQVPASANLNRVMTQVTGRMDSVGGYRSTLDVNQILKKGILAIRGSMAVQHDGYDLKPSGMDSKRINGMINYRPFKNTTITGYYTHYNSYGNRPNTMTPQDWISPWVQLGSPTWDPVAGTVKIGGKVVLTRNPISVPSADFDSASRTYKAASIIFTSPGADPYYTIGYASSNTNPTQASGSIRYATTQPNQTYLNQPLVGSSTIPPVTSKAIYDWSKLNLAAPNYFQQSNDIYSVLIDQTLFNRERQSLNLQLAWFRENNEQYSHNVIGSAGSSGNGSYRLYIDPNEHLLNGSPNPYFLRPYLWVEDSIITSAPLDRDTYRAQVAYKLDLRREKGFLRWLGMHNLSAYTEYKDIISRAVAWRPTIISNHSWIPAGTARGALGSLGGFPTPPSTALEGVLYQMYVGAVGTHVDYAPKLFDNGTYRLNYGNPTAGFTSENVTIGDALYDTTTGGSRTLQKARGAVLQSFLFKDRVVTTYGVRTDENDSRNALPFALQADGINLDYATFGNYGALKTNDWAKSSGPTRTAGIVVKPLNWLNVYANRSDSFVPSSPATDMFFKSLPNPNAQGNDYGFTLRLFGDKLVLRANQYESFQKDSRGGNSATYANRIRRLDFNIYKFNTAPDLSNDFNLQRLATDWVQRAAAAKGQTLSAGDIDTQVAAIMGVPVTYLAAPQQAISATDDVVGKGREIELNYNPTTNWTMKLNVTQQKTTNAQISGTLSAWLQQRLPVWEKIIDPTNGLPWYTQQYNGTQSASTYVAGSITAPLHLLQATVGQSNPQVREYRANYSTNFRLAGITENSILKKLNVGGSLRWESKGAIGYYAVQQLPAIMTDYDLSRPVYEKSHVYADLLAAYHLKLFAGKVAATLQLNVRNIQEGGRLQPVAAYPDGRASAYRIISPRLFIFSTTFDF